MSRAAKFKHYRPKRWHPEFDLIVIESISGKSNEEISRIFGYTKEHISNILSTEEAEEVRQRIRENINESFKGTLQERIALIGEKTIKHIEEFIEDKDGLAGKSPFMFVDRALRIAQAVGSVSDNSNKSTVNNTYVQGNALVMNGEQVNSLKTALEKSRELDSVNVGDTVQIRDVEDLRLKVG